jgi:hypothetical protein
VILGVECGEDDLTPNTLTDEAVLTLLNDISNQPGFRSRLETLPIPNRQKIASAIETARGHLFDEIQHSGLPFHIPMAAPFAILWPMKKRQSECDPI